MIFNLIACLGLVWIIRYGSILDYPRNLIISIHPKVKELFHCSLCLGFWCGLLVGVLTYKYHSGDILTSTLLPFASSAVCWFFDSLLDLIQVSCNKIEE